MKKLTGFLFIIFANYIVQAQPTYPGGLDSIHLATVNVDALAHVPAGAGKFALLIEIPDQVYNRSNNGCGLCGLYNFGTPKILNAGGSVLISGHDTIITITYQPADYNDLVFDIGSVITDCINKYATKVDTSKDVNGFYRHIGIAAGERGADAVFNGLCYQPGISFGSDPRPVLNKIRKIYTARLGNVYNIGAFTAASYGQAGGRIVKFFRKTGDLTTIEVEMKDSLAAHSPTAYLTLKQFSLTNQGVYDTMFSNLGTDSISNIRLNLMDIAGTPPPANYEGRVFDIFPMSTAAQHDPNSPWNFFDGYLVADPKNDVTTDTTSVGNRQHGWAGNLGAPSKAYSEYYPNGMVGQTFYRGTRHCRAVVDMVGVRDMLDTTKKFKFTDIWGLDGEIGGLVINFYNFDKVLRLSYANRPWALARPDSLLTPFATLTTAGAGNWLSTAALDSMRYVLVVITTDGTHSSNWHELKFYGRYNFDTSATAYKDSVREQTYSGPLPSKKSAAYDYNKTVGSNFFNGQGPNSTKYEGWLRLYTGKAGYFDRQNKRHRDTLTFWPTPTYTLDATVDWMRALRSAGKVIRMTNQGSGQYVTNQGNPGWDIDSSGLEPEVPSSYENAGIYAYNWSAKFGDSAVSSVNTIWVQDAGYPNGLDIMDGSAFGNEPEAHGATYPAEFYKLSVEYDGHCGTVGTPGRVGVKAANPRFKLATSGAVEPDTNKIKTFVFLSKIMRPNGLVPFDEIEWHKYYSNKDSGYAITWGLEQQVGMMGVPPEWVIGTNPISGGYLNYWNRAARNVYKYLPTTIPIHHNETGNGNSGDTIHNTTEAASTYDIYPAMAFGPWNNLQAKAIFSRRRHILSCFTPVVTTIDYASKNQNGELTNTNRQLFADYGKAGGSTEFPDFEYTGYFPEWYADASDYLRLTGYHPDTVLLNGGRTGRWQVRFRNSAHSDSICNITWLGSFNGSRATSTVINLGTLATSSVLEVKASLTSLVDTATALTASGGTVTRTVDERPTLYFAKETPAATLPMANAGADFIWYICALNTTPLTLTGSGTAFDGATITGYQWTKLSGPSATITSAASATTTVTGLSSGVYVFQLTVTDSNGNTASDNVTVWASLCRTVILHVK